MKYYIYISDGTWYDKDSICIKLTEDVEGFGIYFGVRNGKFDEELCQDSEFRKMVVENNNVEWV